MGYSIIQVNDMLLELGEEECRKILSQFSCPLNEDVERFLTGRSVIDFARQDITRTYIVFAQHKRKQRIAGYFSIANKVIIVNPSKLRLSNQLKKRIGKFMQHDGTMKHYYVSAPLIAQLGKNYLDDCDNLITGDELLKMALDRVGQALSLIGGKIVYLECEPQQALIDFYKRHGFVEFGRRKLDADEVGLYEKSELSQMLKYMN